MSIEVTQDDREAAANYMATVSAAMGKYDPAAMAFMDEACDALPIVQAFARHRQIGIEQGRVSAYRASAEMAHTLYCYELCNQDGTPAKTILDLLIPNTKSGLGCEKCAMFRPRNGVTEKHLRDWAKYKAIMAEAAPASPIPTQGTE